MWKDIPGSLWYQVSDQGQIRKRVRGLRGPIFGEPLKTRFLKDGTEMFDLKWSGKYMAFPVEDLVKRAFG
jgi:hypothetical protein